ncbi:zinc ribbon domain-containing protein [Methylosinus sp. Sm6]|uniref:FmdB family zinc ribbon protein n=1 Tax=Methylosinus sp. Sm6 TaxID=2866948 RepID=UPI001C98E583|nr:zinc ribbon domain-containing protein [Methylosinus sp. Sm6]MBY6243658.1 zinc ribbon domain-containing protein [Methylosinus sp. Sm6]
MPLYAYNCNSCGHAFETLVRSDDVPQCPSCGGVELTRQLSVIAKPASGGDTAPETACGAMGAAGGCGAGCPAFSDCG